MKICVVGLGLIGGSICLSLKRAGYTVDGYNRSQAPLEYCLEKGIIANAAKSFESYDLVFVALPPEATLKFINGTAFKNGAIVSDICGVKRYIINGITNKNIRYIGTHPMAGKEVSTVFNACENLFDGASMIITPDENSDMRALEIIKTLTRDMGFGTIIECSADIHDKKISYTSQLAHIVANAYVKDSEIEGCIGFTGGSFQDMTRIAGVDEGVWSSLYLANAENLNDRISALILSLEKVKSAISSGDKAALEQVLKEGRQSFESEKKNIAGEKIKVTRLGK